MHPALVLELERTGFVRTPLRPPSAVHDALRRGQLRRILPGIYVQSDDASPDMMRAAVLYLRGRGALSHTTALTVWGLGGSTPDEIVHVVVPQGTRLRSAGSVTVHTRRILAGVRERSGLPVTRVEDALVDSWPYLDPPRRTGAVFSAVTGRLTTVGRLATRLGQVPHLRGRAELITLVDRLAAGCHSPLEIFGADRVFAGLPGLRRQVPVRVGGRRFYLDVYAAQERVDIELDGASWHSGPGQREQDMRRDTALATLGIQVVRFSYGRLVGEPQRVRNEVMAILAARHR
jgi:very-short-patch-repair endonuclease